MAPHPDTNDWEELYREYMPRWEDPNHQLLLGRQYHVDVKEDWRHGGRGWLSCRPRAAMGARRSRTISPCATSLLCTIHRPDCQDFPPDTNGDSILVGVLDEHRNMLTSR